jgi:hypothetical protein
VPDCGLAGENPGSGRGPFEIAGASLPPARIKPSITAPKVMKEKFPKGWKALKPYRRMTPQSNK